METPDRKVKKLMTEYGKTNNLTKAALRADMDRKTARKYVKAGKRPSQMKKPHDWRTLEDPFAEDWAECEDMLADAPELQAKDLFGWLCEQHPGKYQEGQLRTFQRRVKEWRVTKGPDKELYFPQQHIPGARPMKPEWAQSVRDICLYSNTPSSSSNGAASTRKRPGDDWRTGSGMRCRR